MGPGDEESPYLYDTDESDGGYDYRSDDSPNPQQWPVHRQNPNQDLVDMPERIEDPTDLEWMD